MNLAKNSKELWVSSNFEMSPSNLRKNLQLSKESNKNNRSPNSKSQNNSNKRVHHIRSQLNVMAESKRRRRLKNEDESIL